MALNTEAGTTRIHLLVLMVILSPACNSDGGDSGSSTTGGAAIASSSEFINKLCAEFSSCCKAAGLPTDGASCRAVYNAFAPKMGYDGKAAGNCIAELKNAGDAKCDLSLDTSAPSCDLAFASSGTKKPGEACSEDDECAASPMGKVECATRFTSGGTIRKCQVTIRGKQGSSPCIGTVDGNLTWGNSSEGDIPAVGYLCYTSDSLTCSSDTDTCVAQSKVGEACKSNLGECVAGTFCDRSLGKCAMKAAPGGACKSDDGCVDKSHCGDGNICVARSSDGAACSEDSQCLSDSCVNKRCEANDLNDFGLVFLCGSN